MGGVIRLFRQRELGEAIEWAGAGNIALHLHTVIANPATAPRCFVSAVRKGENIGHLFDGDAGRLLGTAKRLGVRVLRVERRGTGKQHIDLCGAPLRKAIVEAEAARNGVRPA